MRTEKSSLILKRDLSLYKVTVFSNSTTLLSISLVLSFCSQHSSVVFLCPVLFLRTIIYAARKMLISEAGSKSATLLLCNLII